MSTFMVFNPGLDNEVSIFYPRVLVSVCGIELQFIITPTFQTIGLVSVRVIITESDPYHRLLSRSSTRRHSGMFRWIPQTRPNARRPLTRRIGHRIKQISIDFISGFLFVINILYRFIVKCLREGDHQINNQSICLFLSENNKTKACVPIIDYLFVWPNNWMIVWKL